MGGTDLLILQILLEVSRHAGQCSQAYMQTGRDEVATGPGLRQGGKAERDTEQRIAILQLRVLHFVRPIAVFSWGTRPLCTPLAQPLTRPGDQNNQASVLYNHASSRLHRSHAPHHTSGFGGSSRTGKIVHDRESIVII